MSLSEERVDRCSTSADSEEAVPASPPRRPRQRVDKRTGRAVMERLLAGSVAPPQLAAEVNVTVEALSKWARRAEVRETLRGLALLADARAQLMLSGFRAAAVVHLMHIAAAPEGSELSRRACVDLLRAETDAFASTAGGGAAGHAGAPGGSASTRAAAPMPEPPSSSMERSILRNLERLAEARENE